jgi:hypothetical protein
MERIRWSSWSLLISWRRGVEHPTLGFAVMARQCFCGCGTKIPLWAFGTRTYDTRARQVVARLKRTEEFDQRDVEEPAIREWYEQGDALIPVLTELVHGQRSANSVDEAAIREWQATGREIERSYIKMAQLGHAMRKSDLSEVDFLQAVARGKIDPYKEP